MNYNISEMSQSTPKGYTERLNPDFMDNVTKNDRRGDFISLISRGKDDQEMVDRFALHWKHNVLTSEEQTDITNSTHKPTAHTCNNNRISKTKIINSTLKGNNLT